LSPAPVDGVICLANDGIVDGLIALCESLRTHSPKLPLTVVPFDANLSRTRHVVSSYGYDLYDDPSLDAMDSLGKRYWRGETWRPHSMRKLCAFWGPYENFLFLDADIVVLRPLEPYFEAFRESTAELMYFSTDLSMVYRGSLLQTMVERGAVGFQTGVFMSRRGALTEDSLSTLMAECEAQRDGFVDVLEQTFLNYAVDTVGLRKLDAHSAVSDAVDAWAGMRLKRTADGFVLADARTPDSGRPVTLIHWGGYALGPFMPYRRIFLRYRLANPTSWQRIAFQARSLAGSARGLRNRSPLMLLHRWRSLALNWLAARGYRVGAG
jgi:hypothetical protein